MLVDTAPFVMEVYYGHPEFQIPIIDMSSFPALTGFYQLLFLYLEPSRHCTAF